ncbi:MAG TPA: GNAT family N-acetyltransferase, partial [Dehalococcoidia bacterium]|nr:GNAT family N-acetyltransferase [Dehalococcoidia bacterium]
MAEQTAEKPAYTSKYPRSVRLNDGSEVTLRLMTKADRDALLRFARSLPADDLLFLRTDITDPDVVDEWVSNLDKRTVSVLAEGPKGEGILGYGSLHYNEANWTRHIGEIRIQAAATMRGKGLGRALAAAVFEIARSLGLQKITARMTPDQQGARATFEKLGFQMEALLQDFVIDRAGHTRDMLVMAYDITGLTDSE